MMKVMISKNLVVAFLCVAVMLSLHSYVFTSWYFSILLISILALVFFRGMKVHSESSLLLPLLIFLLLILYFTARRDVDIYVEIQNAEQIDDGVGFLFMLVSCFIAYVLAFVYGIKCSVPFKIVKYVALFYLVAFSVRVLYTYSDIRGANNAWAGLLFVAILPIAALFFFRRNRSLAGILFCSAALIFMLSISARSAALSLVVFILTYELHPIISATPKRHLLTFVSFMSVLFLFFYIYMDLKNIGFVEWLDSLSLSVFDKTIFSGRNYMWRELYELAMQKPLYGYGTNQMSEYIISPSHSWRTLSSHNTFLEIFFRGGFLGVALFLALLFSVWRIMRSNLNCTYARVGAASMLCVLVSSFFIHFLFFNNMAINIIIWSFWGECCGATVRFRHVPKTETMHGNRSLIYSEEEIVSCGN